ncbi:helix-turn-helix domain-containing protein [Fuchsiella alkaliacetigena]|uniref:helix-turn-helix domain-containing protein n=1 Tax=Fuchsiella alkaliacetigena TaxID=957042 RepID=UPI00200AA833|nr:helix-turn-helix domain-containing protein [Fuchsiella alkaliacetigena]MCK8826107.1 helix-turn-helix domain-containing protein [Fuchsiella alkaliacetigena]
MKTAGGNGKYTNWEEVPTILKRKEVAELLGVNYSEKAKEILDSEHLPTFKLGGNSIRVLKEDLKNFIEKLKKGTISL